MCFSSTASFTSASLLLVVGGLALSQRPKRREVAYALIPVLFGLQQLLEGPSSFCVELDCLNS